MSIEGLIAHYGPVALLVGAALEGETVAMLGGMTAHRGLIGLPVAWGAVFVGTLIADQGLFFIGRTMRERAFVHRLRGTAAFASAQARFERRPTLFVLLFRFLYGLRTASPLMIGMSGFAPARFAALNVVAAFVWSALFVGLGYVFGLGVEELVGRIADLKGWIPYLLIPVVAGLAVKLIRARRAS